MAFLEKPAALGLGVPLPLQLFQGIYLKWLRLSFLLTATLLLLLPQVQLPGATRAAVGHVMPPLMAAAAVTAAPYRALGTKTQLQSKIAAGQAPCQSCEGDESSRSREMELRM